MALDLGSADGAVEVDGLCVALDLDISFEQIVLPVGFSIEIETPILPNPGDIAGRLLASANAALAPLSPIFDLVDLALVLVEIFNALKSVPDLSKFKKLLPKLEAKVDKLKKLIPAIALLASIKSLIGVLILALQGIKIEIQAILEAQAKIDLSAARGIALGLADLNLAVDCAQTNLDLQLDLAIQNADPLNRLINTINVFCDLAGVDGIPAITLDATAGAGAAIDPLDGAIAKLTALREKIPS